MKSQKVFRFFVAVFLVSLALPFGVAARPAPDGFADLVEKLTPAVVNISTSKKLEQKGFGGGEGPNVMPFPDGHPFEDFNRFFEDFLGHPLGQSLPKNAYSLGSGFVISPEGYVVTNNHVIEGADEITITFEDNTEYNATLVGHDPKTDLALLKIESDTDRVFPYVSFGDSDESRVGDWVVVVGNPFGLGGSVTAGIISARARDIHSGPFDDFIQTDAAINRGNSGGPMFNLKGEVIGINTAIYSPNGVGNVGIGFAVPSALAKPVINQLKESGSVVRGWLGVKIQEVTKEIVESLGLEEEKGALVAEVMKDSPAKAAGIQVGDIILEFDGKDVPVMRKLPRIVAETPVGKEVKVKLWRNGDIMTVDVTIQQLDEAGEAETTAPEEEKQPDADDKEVLGMYLHPLTPELAKRYNAKEGDEGLVVTSVKRDSIAAARGINKGDILLESNQEPLLTVEALQNVITQAKEKQRSSILLLVRRAGETIFQALPIDEE